MIDVLDRDEGTRMMPGDSRWPMNSPKWMGIVLTSAETSTRLLSAANFNTSRSGVLSAMTPTWVSKSMLGSRR